MIQSKGRIARQVSAVAMTIGFMLLGTSAGGAQQKSLKSQLSGAWTLVSQEVTPKEGPKRPGVGGPNAKGVLILDASGHYAYVAGAPDRPKLKTTVRKDIPAAELGEAVRTYGANYGTWSVDEKEKTLIRKFQLALVPNNDNQETKQAVSLAKGELTLTQVAPTATTVSVYRRAK